MVIEHRNRFPREAVASPSLEIIKTQVETIPNNLLQLTLVSSYPWFHDGIGEKFLFYLKQYFFPYALLFYYSVAIN